jgi:hypothetical protein
VVKGSSLKRLPLVAAKFDKKTLVVIFCSTCQYMFASTYVDKIAQDCEDQTKVSCGMVLSTLNSVAELKLNTRHHWRKLVRAGEK